MKKNYLSFVFAFLFDYVFAETQKYHYVMITDNSLMIADFAAQLPEEILYAPFISVNSQRELMEAAYFRKTK